MMFFLDFAYPYYILKHNNGKWSWRFEMHDFCGPIKLEWDAKNKDYEPSNDVWPDRSAFWAYFQRWLDAGKKWQTHDVNGFRICIISEE